MLPKPPLAVGAMLVLTSLPDTAAALGLAGMRTQSALNQPFYAEIELTDVAPDEIDAVKARLASRDEFAKAGAERPHFLTRLQFTPAIGVDGRPYIQVSSREPIREPYLDFLVAVVWPGGRLVKEYTVLLDPPARGASAPPRVVAPQTSAPRRRPPPAPDAAPPLRRSSAPPQKSERQRQQLASGPQSAPRPQAAAAPRPAPIPPQARDTRFPLYYGPVQRGATLTAIARDMTPPGATVEQTAMAIFRNNQDAFMRGNINMLRVGVDLVIPTAEKLFALDQSAARRQFEDALAGRSVNSSPVTDVPSDARLRIAAAGGPEPPSPATASSAALPPGAAQPAPADPNLRQDLLMVQETTESNRQETSELRNRISELEQQLTDIQRLLELRNEQLARLQQAVRADEQPMPAAGDLPTPAPPAGAARARSPVSPGEPGGVDATPTLQPDGDALAGAEPTPQAGVRAAPGPDQEPDLVATEPDESGTGSAPPPVADDPELAGSNGGAVAPAADAAPQAEAPAAAQTGGGTADGDQQPFWAGALQTAQGVTAGMPRWAWPAAGGTVVLGGLGLLAHRRRRQLPEDAEAGGEQAPDAGRLGASPSPRDSGAEPGFGAATAAAGELSIDPVPDLDGDAPPASRPKDGEASGGGDIDVQTGLPAGVVFDMSEGQPETQDADVIAEADIYILYGRYREAEALLREELESTPESPALRYKLGEALLGGGNRGALAELLDAMRAAGQDGEDAAKWAHLESGLAGLAADDDDMGGRPPGTGPRLRPSAGAPAPFDADQLPDGEAASKGDAQGEDEGPDLGFSVQDVVPPSAEALPWQMGDLEQLTPPPTDPEPADHQIQWQGAQSQGQTQSPGTAAEEPLAAGPVENAIADDVRSSQWHMDAGLWDEAATKMDLARAYIEMDDPDAARAVLEDVVQEGSEQQRADARAMLARLGWRGSVERR